MRDHRGNKRSEQCDLSTTNKILHATPRVWRHSRVSGLASTQTKHCALDILRRRTQSRPVSDTILPMLAISGGSAIRLKGWPKWPRATQADSTEVAAVLSSGRWAISGYSQSVPRDIQLSERFAEYIGVKRALPVDHGSSAILCALLALEIGQGQEVIVPGLTWIACASAVLRANATPCLVDVDPLTLCLSPAAVEEALTERTAAILVVHLYSSMADVDAICDIGRRYGIPVIEDCSQAHGAQWRGQRAGSFGEISAFSMQQGKVLTCGEGGVVASSDEELLRRLEQLRADGRTYDSWGDANIGYRLVELGEVLGFNFGLTEIQAALLLSQMDRLDAELEQRSRNADYLSTLLSGIPGVSPISAHPQNTFRSYYQYALRISDDTLSICDSRMICAALSAELNAPIRIPYCPLDRHVLLRRAQQSCLTGAYRNRLKTPHPLTNADSAYRSVILLHHSMFLGESHDMEDIADALRKVMSHVPFTSRLPAV